MFRRLPRNFSGFAMWIILGVAIALIPVACGSSGPTNPGQDSGDGPSDMTKPG